MSIHADQGHGHDAKYSRWRRTVFPKIADKRNCYCADIDWVEWRNGKPVAVLECKRALGSKTLQDAIDSNFSLNNGFQVELLGRAAVGMQCKAYLVAIKDSDPDSDEYGSAEFLVAKIDLSLIVEGRINLAKVKQSLKYRSMTERQFAEFISKL